MKIIHADISIILRDLKRPDETRLDKSCLVGLVGSSNILGTSIVFSYTMVLGYNTYAHYCYILLSNAEY